jgi:hypothetical protein
MARWACVALCGSLAACHVEEGPPPTQDGAPSVEALLPTASASAAASALPAWVAELPPSARGEARETERVWATVPRRGSELAQVGVYTVTGVFDGLYSLTDALGQRVDGVSGALVHRTGKTGKLATGDVVLFHTPTAPAMIGRVAELIRGAEIRVRYDWAGATREAPVDHAEPPIEGVKPMAYVAFPKAGTESVGLLVALTDDKGWVRTASGHVEVHDRKTLAALAVPRNALKAGERVRAWRWATGLLEGTVSAIVEAPDLRYRVKLGDGRTEEDYFFAAVFRAK